MFNCIVNKTRPQTIAVQYYKQIKICAGVMLKLYLNYLLSLIATAFSSILENTD